MPECKKLNMFCGVYIIKNIINNKIYIGSSINIHERQTEHKRLLRKKIHHNFYLQRSWDKYGEEKFVFDILEECQPEYRIEREQYYLDLYKSYEKNKGYNICIKANLPIGNKGVIFTEEHKNKISIAQCGEKSGKNKLMQKQVDKIRYDYLYNLKTTKDLSQEYNIVSFFTIRKIIQNKAWKNEKYKTGNYTQLDLSKEYGVSASAVQSIINYRSWKP